MSTRSGMTGPLAEFAPGFTVELAGQGYRPGSAAVQLELMAKASGWLAVRGLDAGDLTDGLVERLMGELRSSGRSRLFSPRALSPLLEYLRGLGAVPPAEPVMAVTAAEVIVERYSAYLRERRCLAPSTVRNYLGVARVFLAWRQTTAGGLELKRLDAAAVTAFVLGEAQRSCVGSAKCLVTRLRALLRFLQVEGEIALALADAVPSVASWRLTGLVKALDSRSLGRLLRGCDRRTRVGRRDHAITRSSPCSRGWGYAPERSHRSGSQTSTGALASCWCAGRAPDMSGCRSRPTSARCSPAGSSAAVPAGTRCSCSHGCERPMSDCRPARSRRSFAAPASEPGCQRSARTVCGTPPPPRCSGRAGA